MEKKHIWENKIQCIKKSNIFFIKNHHVKVVFLKNTMTHEFQKNYNKALEQLRFNDSCRTCDNS